MYIDYNLFFVVENNKIFNEYNNKHNIFTNIIIFRKNIFFYKIQKIFYVLITEKGICIFINSYT